MTRNRRLWAGALTIGTLSALLALGRTEGQPSPPPPPPPVLLKTADLFKAFPPGVILAWYKKSGAFPAGWAVCDGTNGTPDLRNRFLMGVSDMADVGKPGGTNLLKNLKTAPHTLTLAEIPAHTHTQVVMPHQGPQTAPDGNEYSPGGPTGNPNNWSWRGSQTSSAGSGSAHTHDIPDIDNRPAFNTVIYIMKL